MESYRLHRYRMKYFMIKSNGALSTAGLSSFHTQNPNRCRSNISLITFRITCASTARVTSVAIEQQFEFSPSFNCWRYLHTRHAAKPNFFQWKSTDSQSKQGTWSHRQKANIVRQLNVAAWNDRTTNRFPQQKIVYKRIHADTGRLTRTF